MEPLHGDNCVPENGVANVELLASKDQNTIVTRIAEKENTFEYSRRKDIGRISRTECNDSGLENHVERLEWSWPSLQRIPHTGAISPPRQRVYGGLHPRGEVVRTEARVCKVGEVGEVTVADEIEAG